MSAGTSPIVWVGEPARCPIPIRLVSAIRSAASMAACRPATITFFRPGCCSEPKPILRSRNFQTCADGLIFTGGTAQGTTVTDQIDYIATLRGRFGYAFDHWLIYGTGGFAWSQARFGETPCSPAMRTRSSSRAPAGRSASAPRSQLRRTGRCGSNISTTASEPSPASFHRAPVTSQPSTSNTAGRAQLQARRMRTPT